MARGKNRGQILDHLWRKCNALWHRYWFCGVTECLAKDAELLEAEANSKEPRSNYETMDKRSLLEQIKELKRRIALER